ncbi:hypothetical protein [Burkholderia sp. BCC0322]|uniref:hypothetical protein n=1 Tax=unclassified Burkholderia TaxID=2613784 RepID=UPI001589A91C|nr:hypothetical protein [Burkholderia sp. BCC0322]
MLAFATAHRAPARQYQRILPATLVRIADALKTIIENNPALLRQKMARRLIPDPAIRRTFDAHARSR